jgi:hypothetical protein
MIRLFITFVVLFRMDCLKIKNGRLELALPEELDMLCSSAALRT